MMGRRLSAHTDVASNKQVLQETAHGSPPWLIFEPLRAAPPPFPSAPPEGERSENRMGGRDRVPSAQVRGVVMGRVCGCVCVCGCVSGGFRKGKALGHQRDFEAI